MDRHNFQKRYFLGVILLMITVADLALCFPVKILQKADGSYLFFQVNEEGSIQATHWTKDFREDSRQGRGASFSLDLSARDFSDIAILPDDRFLVLTELEEHYEAVDDLSAHALTLVSKTGIFRENTPVRSNGLPSKPVKVITNNKGQVFVISKIYAEQKLSGIKVSEFEVDKNRVRPKKQYMLDTEVDSMSGYTIKSLTGVSTGRDGNLILTTEHSNRSGKEGKIAYWKVHSDLDQQKSIGEIRFQGNSPFYSATCIENENGEYEALFTRYNQRTLRTEFGVANVADASQSDHVSLRDVIGTPRIFSPAPGLAFYYAESFSNRLQGQVLLYQGGLNDNQADWQSFELEYESCRLIRGFTNFKSP